MNGSRCSRLPSGAISRVSGVRLRWRTRRRRSWRRLGGRCFVCMRPISGERVLGVHAVTGATARSGRSPSATSYGGPAEEGRCAQVSRVRGGWVRVRPHVPLRVRGRTGMSPLARDQPVGAAAPRRLVVLSREQPEVRGRDWPNGPPWARERPWARSRMRPPSTGDRSSGPPHAGRPKCAAGALPSTSDQVWPLGIVMDQRLTPC